MNTRDLLVELGFTPYQASFTDLQPGYVYDFGNLQLEAVQVMGLSFRPVMMFSGLLSTPRTTGLIQFEVPLELESVEVAVAMIVRGLGKAFKPDIAPSWLDA